MTFTVHVLRVSNSQYSTQLFYILSLVWSLCLVGFWAVCCDHIDSILKSTPNVGNMHRSIEKISQHTKLKTIRQFQLPFFNHCPSFFGNFCVSNLQLTAFSFRSIEAVSKFPFQCNQISSLTLERDIFVVIIKIVHCLLTPLDGEFRSYTHDT